MREGYAVHLALRLMTEGEARACVDRIKANLETTRSLLFELHEREGWKALSYATWQQCITEEFHMSRVQAHRLINAHMVDRILALPIGNAQAVAEIPESHARALAPLVDQPETLREVYREAQVRTRGFPTEAAIRDVAAELAAPESPYHPDHPSNEAPDPPPFVMPEMERETEEERAYYAFARQRLIVRHPPDQVADAATHPDAALPGFEEFAAWFSRFMARLRANAARPVRAVQ